MSRPTVTAMSRLKKLLGYLKQTMDYAMKLVIPESGKGLRCNSGCGYILESYSDSDWAGNKAHRRSTSAAVHLVNGCTVFATSRSQKVVSLSSAEAELHALVAAVADGVYIRGCMEFLCGRTMEHFALVDNTAAKQIANKKGVGKIRHLAGKVLWIQDYTSSGRIKVVQIPTDLNLADVGTKPLAVARTKALLYCIGMVHGDDGSAVGEAEFEETQRKHEVAKKIKSMAKTLGTIMAIGSLEGVNGQEMVLDEKCYDYENVNVLEGDMVNTSWWSLSMTWALACICMVLAISAVMWVGLLAWKASRKFKQKLVELEERTEAAEEMARGSSVLSQALMRRMNTQDCIYGKDS